MNRVVVNVPDDKMPEFERAMSILGIEKAETTDLTIPEWHKKIVLDRIANSKPGDTMSWDEAMSKIQYGK